MSFYPSLKEICLNRFQRKGFFDRRSIMSAPQTTQTGEALGRLARDDIPFLFDAVSVAPDGAISHKPREYLRFAFDYQGVTFNAEGRRTGDRFVLSVSGDLGPLPFSAESAEARHTIQDLIAASGSLIAPTFTIGEDQAIRVSATLELLKPVSPVGTLTMVTELLLVLKPWLARIGELLEQASRRPRAAAAN
jgi:hypothetical protein